MKCIYICATLSVLLAIAMVRLRSQPSFPATAEEIIADGGKFITTSDGRFIEYFTCGVETGTPLYFQHGYGNTGKIIHVLPNFCAAAESLGLHVISPTQPGFGLSSTCKFSRG